MLNSAFSVSGFSKSFLMHPGLQPSTLCNSNTANISCKKFPKIQTCCYKQIFESFTIVIPSAVKVTAIINTIGTQSINPDPWFSLKCNKAAATSASTDNSWFAEPNIARFPIHPTLCKQVSKYKCNDGCKSICLLLLSGMDSYFSHLSESRKFLKDRRPTLATESSDVAQMRILQG